MEIREALPQDMQAVVSLYHDAGWTNYTNKPAMLDAALRQSLKVLVAVEQGCVVGMIRAVGDGASILYIQDIIVHTRHRRQGIGRRLLQAMDAMYPAVYQKVLLTDDKPQSRVFYEKCGFQNSQTCGCVAMMAVKP